MARREGQGLAMMTASSPAPARLSRKEASRIALNMCLLASLLDPQRAMGKRKQNRQSRISLLHREAHRDCYYANEADFEQPYPKESRQSLRRDLAEL